MKAVPHRTQHGIQTRHSFESYLFSAAAADSNQAFLGRRHDPGIGHRGGMSEAELSSTFSRFHRGR